MQGPVCRKEPPYNITVKNLLNPSSTLFMSQGGQDFTPSLLLQLLGVKIMMTALCKGSGLVGGIYAPSIFMGARSSQLLGFTHAKYIQ